MERLFTLAALCTLTSFISSMEIEKEHISTPKPILKQWIQEVKKLQETENVQHHLTSLFYKLYLLSAHLETNKKEEALRIYKDIKNIQRAVHLLKKENPLLHRLLLEAHTIHLNPTERPFMHAFEQAKKTILEQEDIADPTTLSHHQSERLLAKAWHQCTVQLKEEAETRFCRIVFAGAKLNACSLDQWIEKAMLAHHTCEPVDDNDTGCIPF
jgi:hypothetical protein